MPGASNTGGATTGTSGYCGDGIVNTGESCDDANQIPWDGCTMCKAPGELLWQVPSCGGRLARGNDDSIVEYCPDSPHLYQRYRLIQTNTPRPRPDLQPELGPETPWLPERRLLLVELADGTLFVHTIADNGDEYVHRLNERGEVLWESQLPANARVVRYGPGDEWLVIDGTSLTLFTADESTPVWTAPLELSTEMGTSTGAAGTALIDEEGTTYLAGSQYGQGRMATVWAYNASGTAIWRYVHEIAPHQASRIASARIEGSQLRVLLSEEIQGYRSWSRKVLDLRTGAELESVELWGEAGPVEIFETRPMPVGAFASSELFESYLVGQTGLATFDADGAWLVSTDIRPTIDSLTTIGLLGVVCQTYFWSVEEGSLLTCYLTR